MQLLAYCLYAKIQNANTLWNSKQFYYIDLPPILLGNRKCQGKNYRDQSNFCHYDLDARHRCPPSPIVLNAGENISVGDGEHFCVCAYRKGEYVCAEGMCADYAPPMHDIP